jgi:outer membrane immunogenic protein
MGVGYGLTHASDRLMTKLMVTTNLFDSPDDNGKEGNGKKAQASARTPSALRAMAADIPRKAPAARISEAAYLWGGCYGGAYGSGAGMRDINSADPTSTGGVFPPGSFYNAPEANPANGGFYRYPVTVNPGVGGTAGCNWQSPGSAVVWGVEGEAGYMRLRAAVVDPYSAVRVDDTTDTIRIGDWYGAAAGRLGWAADRALFYAKGGVGFTHLRAGISDRCGTAPCGGGTLGATADNGTRAFWVGGGGIEWAWTGNWTIKAEYLFLALNETLAVCGAGGGTAAGSTFCSSRALEGVHTGKLGLNYRFN